MKRFYVWAMAGALGAGACGPLRAAESAYVATNGANVYPYDTWDKAATNLQAAVDAVDTGGTVWVTNGVYAAGGATVYGMSNRVALTRAVTLQSVNGPDVTFIKGQGRIGAGAVRCAYLTNGAALVGFTLTNGFTRKAGDSDRECSGGGAWLDRGGTVSNCTVSGSAAYTQGGGVFCSYGGTAQACTVSGNRANDGGGFYFYYGGTAQNCTARGNVATTLGGGAECCGGGTMRNCAISGNSAPNGGGIRCSYSGGAVQNCTVSGNSASTQGGGVYCASGGTLVNTVVFANTGGSSSNVYASGTGMSFTNCCTAPAVSGTGNISADPKFVNASAGDYRLEASSPCIDTGTNQTWMVGETDLDGKTRVLNGTVDRGAYEADYRVITVTPGTNGTVSPSGTVRVLWGQPLTVTFTPDADYHAADVLVDGQSLGAMTGYTFENVTTDHTVSMTFLPSPSVTYASTNGASLYPYDTWEKAASAIQDAVNVVHSGGTVWASNGVYAAGGATVYGMSNRVALTRAVTLQSVNGPDVTFIQGQGPLGAGAVRCAYLTNGAALVGFTLTNGFTRTTGDSFLETSGGGAWLNRGGTVSNCTVSGNKAHSYGGGLFCNYGGTVQKCTVSGNKANGFGGGLFCNNGGTALNCAVIDNTTDFYGGGVFCEYGGTVQNCTVSGNSAASEGGGLYGNFGGTLINTVVFANTADQASNVYICGPEMSFTNCCMDSTVWGIGNIAADPLFVNAAAGDYRLQASSPCVNAGINENWMDGATDLDGKPRVLNGTVDIGAYESGFTVTASAGPNGSVSPSGTVFVAKGQSLTVTVTPDADCYVADVLVDGRSRGPSAAPALSYTFSDEANCHTLSATFLAKPAVTYVSTNGASLFPYDTWEKASAVIQNAVDALCPAGGTVWASNGVYAAGGATVNGMSNRVALTRPVTLQSVNGPEVTSIRGQGPLGAGAVRCAYLSNGAALVGFTLTNGFTRTYSSGNPYPEQCGGGVWLDRGGTVSNCSVVGNSAAMYGGGVYCYFGGTVLSCMVSGNTGIGAYLKDGGKLLDCSISDNSGGSFCENGGTVQSCSISDNKGHGAQFLGGGAMQNCSIRGNLSDGVHLVARGTVQDCSISANKGKGVDCRIEGFVKNCSISGNSSGGVFINGGTVQNCSVSGNSSGGVHIMSGTLQNSLISGNSSGGVYFDGGGTLQSCTVTRNSSTSHGGVFSYSGGTLINTVVFGNTGGSSSNVYENGTGMSFTNCCTAPAVTGTGNIAADPKFVNAAAGDYRLRADSPCLDAGLNQAWMSGATDLDGKPRVLNGTVDMGAYEADCTVTVTAGPNGSVSPSGTFRVPPGQPLTVTVTPDTDYYVADVIVDGQSMGPSSAARLSHTFADVTNSHSVSATFLARPTVAYVSTNGASLCPYDTWDKASATIQNAVDYVRTGGTVWVTNGVYAAGGATVYGMSNRVALTRTVTLQSVNGPEVTAICGQGPLGSGAVRCAYVTNGATLAGFTLTNGFTRTSGDTYRERSGGGAWLDRGSTVSNCTVSGNTADYFGGGVFCSYGGTVLNGVLSGNSVCVNGGGVFNYQGGFVRNCTVCGNSANDGAGLYCSYGGTVQNCTVSGNSGRFYGGGICCLFGGTVVNTISYGNTACDSTYNIGAYGEDISFTACCTDTGLEGTGNIAADPLFVNAAAGDFRLQTNSPCIDAGTNQTGMDGATDLDDRPRVINGTVDIGAYEAILPGWDEDADGLPDEWEWGQARTLTGLAPDADADGDGANNLAEYGADTDPFSGASLLALTSIAPEAGGMRVAWRGGQNAWQFLERSTNLSAGAEGWTAVYTNVPPTAPSVEALDLTPAGDKAFYRVRAQR